MSTELFRYSPEDIKAILSPDHKDILMSNAPYSFDLDGVVVSIDEVGLGIFNSRHGTSYTLDDLHRGSMDAWYMQKTGCTKEEADRYTRNTIWNSQECMEKAKPVEGAVELINHFNELEIPFRFITSRPFTTFSYTENWFRINDLDKHFLRVLMQTSVEFNAKYKPETIGQYQIKYHFEDMVPHVKSILEQTDAMVVLVNYPSNELVPDHPRIIRAANKKDYGNVLASYQALIKYLTAK